MKKIILLLALLFISCNVAFTEEKIPIRIVPAENISTALDEVQIGDYLLFKVKNDIYENEKLIFKKDTIVAGYVSFLDENGWGCDNAEIQLNEFKLKNTNREVVTINSEVRLNGFELLKTKGKRCAQFFNYIGVIFRGKEVDIKCDKDRPVFTIWYVTK